MNLIPFEIDDLNAGFAKIEGTISLKSGVLHFEFHKTDDVVGAFKSSVKQLKLQLSDVIRMEYKKKLFGGRIIIRANSESAFGDLEGQEFSIRTLKVKKSDRNLAADLVTHANIYLSEEKLRRLDEE
jgi:hypothetical protein